MDVLEILCPKCGTKLKLRDRTKLGKVAKCPKCSHRFKLEAPLDDATIELAEETPPPRRSDSDATAVIDPAAGPPVPEPPETVVGEFPAVQEPEAAAGAVRVTEPAPPAPAPFVAPPEESVAATLRGHRRRRGRRKLPAGPIVAAVLLLIAAGVGYLIYQHRPAAISAQPVGQRNPAPEAGGGLTTEAMMRAAAPTAGEPIELLMVPSGVRALVHLRPAELWSQTYRMQELRASLTADFVSWIETHLKSVCRRDPAQIERCLIAYILGARGTEPQIATVVHLVDPVDLGQLLQEFNGKPLRDPALGSARLNVGDEYAYLIRDERTIAICPAEYAEELPSVLDVPNEFTTAGISELLRHTDQQRQFTAVAEMSDLRQHRETLFPPAVHSVVAETLDWLGSDVQTLSWNLHVGEHFYSELRLRPVNTASTVQLEQRFRERLPELPERMQRLVRQTSPTRLGFRKLTGRFPAMLEAARRATLIHPRDRHLQLVTLLPAKAAPNLALGTLLTWDALRIAPGATSATVITSTAGPSPADSPTSQATEPQTVRERLDLPVDAEFNRTPLEEAIQYIAGEIGVTFEIDGDALKDAGYTKNMPQSFDLGRVPAREALKQIFSQYDAMVLSIDEPNNTASVLTRKFAEQQGRPVEPL